MEYGTQFGDELAAGNAGQLAPASLMDANWCGLTWTPWARLERGAIRQTALTLPGVYRIRRQGDEPARLTYIGQTGRGLRERLLALAAGVNGEDCPYNDPHTAAPHLWLLRRLNGAQFAFSCAVVSGDMQTLRGTEDMLLWQHQIETGLSTEANYGRFYPGYARPTNRWVVWKGAGGGRRARGRTAQPHPAGVSSPDFGLVIAPLRGDGGVLQAPWWQRARLAEGLSLPNEPGVYCIYEGGADEPVYIGETSNLQTRSITHAATSWPLSEPWIGVLSLTAGTPKYVLHELESDLLGWHFWQMGRAPVFQYRKLGATGDSAA